MRRKLSEKIVEDILRGIGSGAILEGEDIEAEAELIERYGVSRSVTREALNSLAAKGFLTVRQGATTVVSPRFRWNVLDPVFLQVNAGKDFHSDLVEAREAIEPQVVRIAAERATKDDVAVLLQILERLSQAPTPEENAELDVRFHRALAEVTRNPILTSVHDSLSVIGYSARASSGHIPGAIDRARFWHELIVERIAAGDGHGAESAMLLHLRQVATELERVAEADRSSGPTNPSNRPV